MNEIRIQFLGTGGCLNSGLPYNSFMIDRDFLVEAPPDIMLSLKTQGVSVSEIKKIFISHLHGDHYFGLPFIVINRWIDDVRGGDCGDIEVLCPRDSEDAILGLIDMAFSKSHPCYHWAQQRLRFIDVDEGSVLTHKNLELNFRRLIHIDRTFGVTFSNERGTKLAYIADTRWCSEVEQILNEYPECAIIDMNGGKPDVHISVEQVIDKGLKITGRNTMYYGTHLADNFTSENDRIKCAVPGMEIEIRY